MRRDELPIDYEELTPGPTGFYGNLNAYPQIIRDWDDAKILEEMETLQSLLDTQPRNYYNIQRIILMVKAEGLIAQDLERRTREKDEDEPSGTS